MKIDGASVTGICSEAFFTWDQVFNDQILKFRTLANATQTVDGTYIAIWPSSPCKV
jgi:hypothetical protein